METIEEIIKVLDNELITEEGEMIKLHDEQKEELAKVINLNLALQTTSKIATKTKGYEKYKQKTELEQIIKHEYGSFYFSFYKKLPITLDRQYKFRFLYMCCFLKFDDNKMYIKKNISRFNSIKEGDLMKLLKLSRTETHYTKKELIDNNLISINDDGAILINNEYCLKNTISKKQMKGDYTRIMEKGLKHLYENSKAKDHKKLGMFIELLPYVHFKFNIICFNPNCEHMEEIVPLTLKDIAEKFNIYKSNNITSLKKSLLHTFIHEQKVLMIIEDYDKKFIVVNPMIFYKGTDVNDIKYLINLFKI